MHRIAAAVVALVCWIGLAVQFSATYSIEHEVASTLWILVRFFTITTNLLVAVVMTAVAIGRRVQPAVLAGLTLAIILVGTVYMILLRGLLELSGAALAADTLLHKMSPIVMTLYWLMFVPHGRLRWGAPFWWTLYPLAYLAYAIGRGAIDGLYPYPFIDVGQIGIVRALLNAAVIGVLFILSGLAMVALDRHVLRGAKAPR